MMSMEALLTNPDPVVLPRPFVKWSYEPPRAAGRAGGAGPRIPPRAASPARAGVRLGPDGRLVGRGRRGVGAPGHRAGDHRPGRPRPGRAGGSRAPARGRVEPGAGRRPRRRRRRRLGRGRRAGRAVPAARVGAARLRLGARRVPRGPSATSRACCRPAIGPLAQTLEPYDLVLVVGAPVFTYYPYIPGPVLPEGTSLVLVTNDPAGGRPRACGRRDRGGRGAHARGAARACRDARPRRLPRRGRHPSCPPEHEPDRRCGGDGGARRRAARRRASSSTSRRRT